MTDQSVIKKRQRKPQARPTEILEAALDLFAERGFAATRMEDVAAKSGISKGALYLYFPDKVALLKSLVEVKAGETMTAALAMIDAAHGPVAPLIAMMLEMMAERLETTNLAQVLKLVLSEGRSHPAIGRAHYDLVVKRGLPTFEKLIARGVASGEFRAVDPALTVRSIIAPMILTVFWMTVFEPLGADKISPRALARHHAELILHGLKA